MNNTLRRGSMPVVVLRDTVLFPRVTQQLDMVRPLSIKAVRRAVETGQEVFITMQKDPSADNPGAEDIYNTGVIASVKQIVGEITNTPADNVWVHATHAITTPHAPDGPFGGPGGRKPGAPKPPMGGGFKPDPDAPRKRKLFIAAVSRAN